MFQIDELKLAVLIEASRVFEAKLMQSPVWGLIEDEPVVKNWRAALQVVEDAMPKPTA